MSLENKLQNLNNPGMGGGKNNKYTDSQIF